MQERYWNLFCHLKINSLYTYYYHIETERIDRYLRIFLAITSSASIAAWTIWKEISYIWGGIIAFSQLLNAVKDYLPYQNRMRKLSAFSSDLNTLLLLCERKWYDEASGDMTESEIHQAFMDLKENLKKIDEKYFSESPLPRNNKIFEKAELEAATYFKTFYNSPL
ncbi:hypothetical protein Ctha_0322 [Chloroherpeton thalassium ATCC 35110]|uniref:SMODS and SLOG-associating 2TM effector domain-containing protein n=1 Tax=Chloroherpeton thalassium (strain ATCC 35110 / GB-78) TaxID=517418 RepID=B3QTZ5_CHLT3|nr:hypothetical protein [Chloroherpeton thalassium]ACF12793.1 hypothetical protein Ctha_0322 [Chloroherpeton thalassium ATCC 35110]